MYGSGRSKTLMSETTFSVSCLAPDSAVWIDKDVASEILADIFVDVPGHLAFARYTDSFGKFLSSMNRRMSCATDVSFSSITQWSSSGYSLTLRLGTHLSRPLR